MNKYIEVALLTKSKKNNGYCVAGIDVNSGGFVRLVSGDPESHGALTDQDIQYKDKSFYNFLDVARIPIISKEPIEYQPENVLIERGQPWEKIGRLSLNDLLKLHPPENHFDILGNVYPYITNERISTVGYSLVLIKVENLIISHPHPGSTKADFEYRSTTYSNLSVTDPDYYHTPNQTVINHAILVVSLPDAPYMDRYFYKFVAKIIPILTV